MLDFGKVRTIPDFRLGLRNAPSGSPYHKWYGSKTNLVGDFRVWRPENVTARLGPNFRTDPEIFGTSKERGMGPTSPPIRNSHAQNAWEKRMSKDGVKNPQISNLKPRTAVPVLSRRLSARVQ
jgi:hypothetical protein